MAQLSHITIITISFNIKNLIITVTRKRNIFCRWPGSCPKRFVSGMSTQDNDHSVLGNPIIAKELALRGAKLVSIECDDGVTSKQCNEAHQKNNEGRGIEPPSSGKYGP